MTQSNLHVQAVDFSALSAQTVARVERARQAAQQQIAAAFQEKPKLALRLRLEAPKIAIPVPSTFDDQGAPPFPPFHIFQFQRQNAKNPERGWARGVG